MLRRNFALATVTFAVCMLLATDASATAQRTFVASYGAAANTAFNCSIAKPCRALSEALSVTGGGGEVIVLDSAGYGTVVIAQSVSIIAPPGIYAGVSVLSGDGITIDGAGIRVVLRGLSINGLGGTRGIFINDAADVEISNCIVSNMTGVGLWTKANGRLLVRDSLFQRNSHGVYQEGGGSSTFEHIVSRENGFEGMEVSASTITVTGSTLEHNGQGGLTTHFASYVTVRDTVVQWNGLSGVAVVDGYLRLSTSLVTINGWHGVYLLGSAQAWLVDNTIHNNLQIVSVDASEVCACGAGSVAFLSGNAITSSAASALGAPGLVRTFRDNKADSLFSGNVTPPLPLQ